MAGKTIKKKNVPTAPTPVAKVLPGTPVKVTGFRYQGVDTAFSCTNCGSKRKRGMMFRLNDVLFCSRSCVAATIAKASV